MAHKDGTIGTTGLKFRVAKHITLPLLKLDDNGQKPTYVKIEAPIFRAKKTVGPAAAEGSKAAMEAPELVQVVNLETGEVMQMIVSAVMGIELRDKYPDDSYVGKAFEVIKHKVQGGKRYATFEITEIELDEEDTKDDPTIVQAEPQEVEAAAEEEKQEAELVGAANGRRSHRR